MQNLAVYFTGPRQVEVRSENLSDLPAGQVLVRTLVSAVSAGTEMLVYRDQFPGQLAVDENIPALEGRFAYPLKYGYASAGQVVQLGEGVPAEWEGRLVFAFQPHQSAYRARPADLIPVPDGIEPEEAVFLPNLETAVNLLMDGAPLVGEDVIVLGQGVVGLLTTALLGQFPLGSLITLDHHPLRRQLSLELGADQSLAPVADCREQVQALFPGGADLVYELSGFPETLNQAISLAGYDGRVVVGSWYGQKRASLDLGSHFHRSHIRLVSSQVSRIAPGLSGRWSKERRFKLVWELLRRLDVKRLITQRFPVTEAVQAYQLLDQHPEQTVQVLFMYD
jgi:2-desacetyl-2-hydroxyethyl bacteriochlorophyllide A dehydrogenase